MKKIAGILFMLIVVFTSHAQTGNSGYIKDETGNPIGNATIHLLNTDVSVISNDSGYFSLPNLPAGRYNIETSAIGYAKTDETINLPSERNISVSMQKSNIQLDEVIVSAEKKKKPIIWLCRLVFLPCLPVTWMPIACGQAKISKE